MKIRNLLTLAAPRAFRMPAWAGLVAACGLLCQCASEQPSGAQVVVSVRDQKLAVYDATGHQGRKYPVSTSRFGINDRPGTYGTPVGMHEVVAKIGQGARIGAVFKNRRLTGEVIKPGTPGRDPIVSRIMWLRGLEPQNRNAYGRCIYIHGTADEAEIGRPVSFGCIRMKSRDVIDLFNLMPIGARVYITQASLPATVVPGPVPGAVPPSRREPLLLNPQSGQAPSPAVLSESRPAPQRAAADPSARRVLPDGSSVIYSAPESSGPGVILRSRRKASQ